MSGTLMSFGKVSEGRTVKGFPFYAGLEEAMGREERGFEKVGDITIVRQRGVLPAIVGWLTLGENPGFVVNRAYNAAARVARRNGADFAVIEHVGVTLNDGRNDYFPEFELEIDAYRRRK